jgi:ATP-binding cassette subfamily F protein uup
LALDGAGGHCFYGSYEQWEQDRSRTEASKRKSGAESAGGDKTGKGAGAAGHSASGGGLASGGKLTYKLKRELEQMEQRILDAEERVASLQQQADAPDVMADRPRHEAVCRALGEAQQTVQRLYDRWAELEKMRKQAGR